MRNGLIGLAGAWVVCTGSMAVVGCSSEDEPAGCGETEVTSLCGAVQLNTLTQAEELQLCNDTGAYVAGAISRATGCRYAAIVAAASNSSPTEAELQAACSASESACNQDGSTSMRPGENTQCSRVPPTCTATVEQYSSCVMAEAVVFEQGGSALISCSMLTFGNLNTVYEVPSAASEAPGCMALKTACPGFSLPYIN